MVRVRILYIEPFDAGSHAAFTRTLTGGVDAEWTVLTLPGRHWKWRARGSAAYFARAHGDTLGAGYDLLLAGSFLPLAELVGLVPSLSRIPKLLYFHENQLAYPVREERASERDLHFGFSQMVSALAAERCAFNSTYNLRTFLEEGERLLSRLPDAAPPGWTEAVEKKSEVLPLPLDLPRLPESAYEDTDRDDRAGGPVILWNHRWEHDKAPEVFFGALLSLARDGLPFRVIVCGERYREAPPIFEKARGELGPRVLHFGYAASRDEYESLLSLAHLAVSTARHEFFGIGMLEAAHHGARPLVPDRLAYPEHFPQEYRYEDDAALTPALVALCNDWTSGAIDLRADRSGLTAPFGKPLLERYRERFEGLAGV